ncbi:hypothetical protein FCIRC_100 [Fusarium circinatum]|uniref:Uncharacterized protein n=1 Tax=Fusarium circinatum TaxID=48490 RepID=A0A8H5XEI7_FUSCI|nr:hypothetical protein FCIRC_100 [Fusarium circinatum]
MSDAQRNRRRASSRHEDEPPAKRIGRPKKAVHTSQADYTATNRVQARRMIEEHPRLQKTGNDLAAFYRETLSWHVYSAWDPEDDDAINAEWEQSAQRATSMRFTSSRHSLLLTMFKVCLRLFKSTPIEILSPYHSLRYQAVSPNGLGNEWIYSKTFCEDFTALMVHPFWESDTDLFATALQWTVICRLGDDRLWTGQLNMPCPALDYVYSEVERCNEAKVSLSHSYHEMHVSQRERMLERGESPGEWSDLFYQIGELASKQTVTWPKEEFLRLLGLPVLPVTVQDLKTLAAALDSTDLRPEWNYSVQEASQGWKAENSGQELPEMNDLSLVHEIAWKSVFRHVRLVKGTRESDSPSPFRDEEDLRSQDPVHTGDGADNESEPEIAHRLGKLHRRQIVGDESDMEVEFIPHPPEGNDENDFTGDNLEDNFGFDMPPEEPTQTASGIDVLRARGPLLSSRRSPGHPAPSVYPSFHDEKMASEIASLKEENAKLCKLVLEGQKEQRQLILDMKTQLDSVQSELSELRKAKEASTQNNNVQGQLETPSPPQITVTVFDSAPKSPELGTSRYVEGVTSES